MAKREKKVKKGAPAWMASFADLQQLLLVFFILLFSMSSVDENKFSSAMASIQEALDSAGLGLTDKGLEPLVELIDIEKLTSLEEMKESQVSQELAEAKEFLEQNEFEGKPLSEYMSASGSEEGVILTINDVMLFDSGSAEIKTTSEELIKKIEPLLNNKTKGIRVEGHTDNAQIVNTSKYADNWELSTARATKVSSFIIDNNMVDAAHISVAGYSEYRPVAKNDTDENKAKNRRVDIVLLSDFTEIEELYKAQQKNEDSKNNNNEETKDNKSESNNKEKDKK